MQWLVIETCLIYTNSSYFMLFSLLRDFCDSILTNSFVTEGYFWEKGKKMSNKNSECIEHLCPKLYKSNSFYSRFERKKYIHFYNIFQLEVLDLFTRFELWWCYYLSFELCQSFKLILIKKLNSTINYKLCNLDIINRIFHKESKEVNFTDWM